MVKDIMENRKISADRYFGQFADRKPSPDEVIDCLRPEDADLYGQVWAGGNGQCT